MSVELSLLLLLLLLLLLALATGPSGCSCASLVLPVVRRFASVISVSCSKPNFSSSGGLSGGGADGDGNAEMLLLLLLPGSFLMLMALEAAPLRPPGGVSCVEAPPPPVPWRPEHNDRGLAPVARALQWSSSRLLPCGNDTVLYDPLLVYDLLLHLHIEGICLCNQTAQSQFGAMALVALADIGAPMEHVVATRAL